MAQGKPVKPLSETAPLPDTQKWLVEAIRKNASYKTRVNSAVVSKVKFEGCNLGFTIVRKTGTTGQDVMGVTTRTHTVKQDVAFDLSFIEAEGIRLSDHILTEFQTITIRFRAADPSTSADRDVEIIVKHEAAEPIRAALKRARKLCIEQ
jgi:hypothetical protein